jgi:uncharacterized protein (TIGR00255 family)
MVYRGGVTLRSMTGFGRASADAGDRRLRVEARSVNHRGLDLKIRSAEPDAFCEAEISRAVRAAFERGAITVHVRSESPGSAAGIDLGRVREVHAALQTLRQELDIMEPVSLATIAAFTGPVQRSDLEGEALWELLRPVVAAALDELGAMRSREGVALTGDLAQHRRRLLDLAAALRVKSAALPEKFAQRLKDRLAAAEAQPGMDPGRLAQEIAIMAERLDVSEELLRLDTHLAHMAEMLEASGALGRKLDFLIQEIGRELNTIASKSQDAEIAALVIDAKAELERAREQAQNVE